MSKTANEAKLNKKAKKKMSGFDIVYRVVTALLAAATFPIAYFMNLIYYALDWTNAINLINNIKDVLGSENLLEGIKNLLGGSGNSAEQATEITYGYICLAKLDEFKSLLNTASSGNDVNIKEMLFGNPALRPLVISLALFAVVLILALVILIISIFKNKPKIVAALSGAGVVLGITSNVIFVTRFANPLVDGTTTLGSVIGSDSIILQMLGKVVELRYENAFYTVLFLMIAILIWSLSVMIVNSDDKTEKALKKAKKAEKKAKKAQKDAKKAEKKAKDEAKDAEKKAKKASEILKEEKKKEEKEAEENSARETEN